MINVMIKCALDEDNCISLLSVLRIMNQVNQEQTWAIAYEVAALMQRLWPAGNCATIESLAQIYIHREGFIHHKSLITAVGEIPMDLLLKNIEDQKEEPASDSELSNHINNNHQELQDNAEQQQQQETSTNKMPQHQQEPLPPTPPITPELSEEIANRRQADSEADLVASLGTALFWALDYGIPDDEERTLSWAMEFLIIQCTQSKLTLNELQDICIKRCSPVSTKQQADLHYRNVCKSLINDTIELSIFLDKIYTASMVLGDFHSTPTTTTTTNGAYNGSTDNNSGRCCCGSSSSSTSPSSPTSKDTDDDDDQMSTNNNNNITTKHCDIHRHLHQHHLHHHIDEDDLSELGLPLASLKALKINDWARLWMQVIRELRQRGKFIKQ